MRREWEQAARCGDARSLRAQIAGGADVDSLDRFGQSALMLAARAGHLEAVEALVASGANLDTTAKFGLSATMLQAAPATWLLQQPARLVAVSRPRGLGSRARSHPAGRCLPRAAVHRHP